MMTAYEFFRHEHLEWVIYTGILAFWLRRCFLSEGSFERERLFVPGSMLTAVILFPLINLVPFTPVFSSQGSNIWLQFLAFFLVILLWLAICFRSRLRDGAGYTLYFLLFIVLVKGTLVPLYSSEYTMDHVLYVVLDIATILALCAALLLLTRLFDRHRLMIRHSDAPDYYNQLLFMPLAIIVIYSLFVSGSTFFLINVQPVLSGGLALLLPLLYYNYAKGSKALTDSRELETALLRTRADLAHYRGLIEQEDRLRKERHELKNRYLHIRILLQEGRLEELDQYLSDEIGARMDALSSVLTGNTLVDYILQTKQKEAEDAGIPLRLSVAPVKLPRVNDDLFCTILLNLLDNAIEASAGEKEPEIQVTLRSQGAYLILQVRNRISRNILLFNPALLTTKKDSLQHGHGVSIVRSAVKELGGMMEIRTDEGYFDVTTALPGPSEGIPAAEGVRGA